MLKIDRVVYRDICKAFTSTGPEHGGVLGAREDGIVRYFYFDYTGVSSANGYKPDTKAINDMLMSDWLPNGIRVVGIVHSHAEECIYPSCGDVFYASRILCSLVNVDAFHIPIYASGSLKGYEVRHLEGKTICRAEDVFTVSSCGNEDEC